VGVPYRVAKIVPGGSHASGCASAEPNVCLSIRKQGIGPEPVGDQSVLCTYPYFLWVTTRYPLNGGFSGCAVGVKLLVGWERSSSSC